jgi:hypothetical protein
VSLSRCEVRDHINYRKNDPWRSYRFYRALQRLKSPMRYICEIFGAPRFSSFSTQSARTGHSRTDKLLCQTLSVRTDSILPIFLSVSRLTPFLLFAYQSANRGLTRESFFVG